MWSNCEHRRSLFWPREWPEVELWSKEQASPIIDESTAKFGQPVMSSLAIQGTGDPFGFRLDAMEGAARWCKAIEAYDSNADTWCEYSFSPAMYFNQVNSALHATIVAKLPIKLVSRGGQFYKTYVCVDEGPAIRCIHLPEQHIYWAKYSSPPLVDRVQIAEDQPCFESSRSSGIRARRVMLGAFYVALDVPRRIRALIEVKATSNDADSADDEGTKAGTKFAVADERFMNPTPWRSHPCYKQGLVLTERMSISWSQLMESMSSSLRLALPHSLGVTHNTSREK